MSTAFFSYTPELQKIIHAFKYQGLSRLDAFFEKEILKRWASLTLEGDCLVPVPLHSARLRERGYNQSEVLAQLFSRQIGLPCAAGVLERVRYTEQQAKLNAEERRRNVQGAFLVRHPDSVRRRHIVLVDDVLTTGSTLNECSRVLKAAGAARIDVLTLARVE
ncbi:MAG: ComF family protein [candidate division KSB1 bacterium]|nr:ComF family protein [candidate division KSB1 bacterium]MDZ7346673.1 ComF family protein [candidate division KSB1 bacterium]